MKTKFYFLAALATVALASCSDNEFVGDNEVPVANDGAIVFGSNAGKMTRATSNTGTVAVMLDHHFKFYGAKNVSGYTDAFVNYVAWDATTKTTSNPDGAEADANNTARMNGWEYVGDGTAHNGTNATQTIKYWDYSATDYHFVAGSPASEFTFNITSGDITSATVTGIKGHILTNPGTPGTTTYYPVYIADPVKVVPANYKEEVLFSFKRQQSFVRVGIFETIPGYSITDIKFYTYDASGDAWETTPKSNIVLASKTADYFQGTLSEGATATVTYSWTEPTYTFAYDNATLTRRNNWYGGRFALNSSNPLVTTSTATEKDRFYGTDQDMDDANRYFTVLPSPSALDAQPILIKCDYQLTADDGEGEVINVKGATAAIPAAFCKWKPNTTYTYLFKISDNTNGTTGTTEGVNEGLYPITFDAAVIAEEDAMKQGYITTVSTPSITTYQAGSVKAAGIQYTVAQGAIYFTAQDDETGELKTLGASNYGSPATGQVQVYKVAAGTTEADLILTRPAEGTKFSTGGGGSAWSINGQSVPAAKWASFTPDAAGTYAIEYATSASSFAYKIVVVE